MGMVLVELHLTSSQKMSLKPLSFLALTLRVGALGRCSLSPGFVSSHPFISCLIGSPINLFICEGGWITMSYSISRNHSLRQRGQALSSGWLLDEGTPWELGSISGQIKQLLAPNKGAWHHYPPCLFTGKLQL